MFHSKWDKQTRMWKIGLCVEEEERTMALRYMEQILRFGRPHNLNEALNLLYAQQGDDLIKHEEFFRQLLDRQPVSHWYDIMQNEYDRLGHRMCATQDAWLASLKRGA